METSRDLLSLIKDSKVDFYCVVIQIKEHEDEWVEESERDTELSERALSCGRLPQSPHRAKRKTRKTRLKRNLKIWLMQMRRLMGRMSSN